MRRHGVQRQLPIGRGAAADQFPQGRNRGLGARADASQGVGGRRAHRPFRVEERFRQGRGHVLGRGADASHQPGDGAAHARAARRATAAGWSAAPASGGEAVRVSASAAAMRTVGSSSHSNCVRTGTAALASGPIRPTTSADRRRTSHRPSRSMAVSAARSGFCLRAEVAQDFRRRAADLPVVVGQQRHEGRDGRFRIGTDQAQGLGRRAADPRRARRGAARSRPARRPWRRPRCSPKPRMPTSESPRAGRPAWGPIPEPAPSSPVRTCPPRVEPTPAPRRS